MELRNELEIKNQEINDHKEELKYVYESNKEKMTEKEQIIKKCEEAKNESQQSFL